MTTRSAAARQELKLQLFMVVLSAFFSTVTLAFPFLVNGSTYHDNEGFYSIYRDNLHCLNAFGGFALWHPGACSGTGFPFYYVSLLGTNSGSPLSA